ncbi:MAG: thioredoxin family protein [Myxococcota bacterium]
MTELLHGRCDACRENDPLPLRALTEARDCASCGAARLPFRAPLELADPRQLDALERAALPLLVAFGAAWCGATHQSEAALEALAEREQTRLVVVCVDVDAHPELAAHHRVRSLPTLVWRAGGREVNRFAGGLQPAALAEWAAAQRSA